MTIYRFSRVNNGRTMGITLLELMMVLAVIAILAAIAYPSYVNQVRKSKRAVAKSVLLEAANREEQYFFTNKAYTGTLSDLSYTDPAYFGPDHQPSSSANAIYQLTLTAVNSGSGTCGSDPSPCFLAQAAPQNDQANDSECDTFTLTSSNTKGAAGGNCW